jgi:hypothetical protein
MIHPLPGMSHRDIDQWFGRGVVMATISPGEPPIPALFLGVNDDTNVVVQSLLGANELRYTLPYTSVAGFWPMCGSVNVPEYGLAVQVNRLTTKQFRRTFNSQCVEIRIPRHWEAHRFLGREGRPRDGGVNFSFVARACTLAEYPSFDEACRRIDSGEWFSVAISRRFIVAGDPSGKRIFYYDGEAAATAIDGQLYPMGDVAVINRLEKVTGGTYRATQCY